MKSGAVWVVVAAACYLNGSYIHAQTLAWERTFGTTTLDDAQTVAVDQDGGVYVAGRTFGDLDGTSTGYYFDAFLQKYDADGGLIWSHQFGTPSQSHDEPHGVAVDGQGGIYVSGATQGDLDGPNQGGYDVFVRKYNADGALQWAHQLGTDQDDYGTGASTDASGNLYVTGVTAGGLAGPFVGEYDAFLAKYDTDGGLIWSRQLGTSRGDSGIDVATDNSGNAYITGFTDGDLGGERLGIGDAFISKFDVDGGLQWTRQFGTSADDISHGITIDGLGNVFVAGWTGGDLGGPSAGDIDAFVSKYDTDGTLIWSRQVGTAGVDRAWDVAADGLGGAYIVGQTSGSLEGSAGGIDAFLSRYSADGTLEWTRQLGGSLDDIGLGTSIDDSGNVYVAGGTGYFYNPPEPTDADAFLAKFTTDITPGDANLDGLVDGLDYIAWAEHYAADPVDGPPGSLQNGDFNGDGVIDGLDYFIWAQDFGSGLSAAAVPEPATSVLCALAVAGLIALPSRTRG